MYVFILSTLYRFSVWSVNVLALNLMFYNFMNFLRQDKYFATNVSLLNVGSTFIFDPYESSGIQ